MPASQRAANGNPCCNSNNKNNNYNCNNNNNRNNSNNNYGKYKNTRRRNATQRTTSPSRGQKPFARRCHAPTSILSSSSLLWPLARTPLSLRDQQHEELYFCGRWGRSFGCCCCCSCCRFVAASKMCRSVYRWLRCCCCCCCLHWQQSIHVNHRLPLVRLPLRHLSTPFSLSLSLSFVHWSENFTLFPNLTSCGTYEELACAPFPLTISLHCSLPKLPFHYAVSIDEMLCHVSICVCVCHVYRTQWCGKTGSKILVKLR